MNAIASHLLLRGKAEAPWWPVSGFLPLLRS